MGVVRIAVVAFALGLAGVGSAGAFDAATVYPGCGQQRQWCERAAAASYGDPVRFRNALSAVVALEWRRNVEAARRTSPVGGHLAAPAPEKIASDLYASWRAGDACCDVVLRPPTSSEEEDVDQLCRRGASSGGDCLGAVRRVLPR